MNSFVNMLLKTNTIIGHRGCRLWMPEQTKGGSEMKDDQGFGAGFINKADSPIENTIESFLKGVELGAEVVEMDIRRTYDGVLVVHHDPMIGSLRIRGATWSEVVVKAEKLRAEGGKVAVLKFEEVLQALEGKVKLDIELKESGYEEEVVGLTLKYFEPSNFIVKSFLDETVKGIKKHFPTVTCGLLLGIGKRDDLMNLDGWPLIKQRFSEFFPWKRVRLSGADFISPNWKLCLMGLLGAAKRHGVPVLVWTLNEPKMLRNFMKSYAVAGIITDRPDLALEIRKNL